MVNSYDLVRALKLDTLVKSKTPALNIETPEVNRPGLQLAGYWDYFACERPQLLGKAETSYLEMLPCEERQARIAKLLSFDLPCVIMRGRTRLSTMRMRWMQYSSSSLRAHRSAPRMQARSVAVTTMACVAICARKESSAGRPAGPSITR